MLDYDPAVSARAHSDEHVKQCPFRYAQVLAAAWHDLHNSARQELNDLIVDTPWFQYVAPDPRPYTDSSARPRSAFPGESPYSWWSLFGQRVPSPRLTLPHPADKWAMELGGNYSWLWRLSMELVTEYRERFGARHPAAPAIWTMELVPFSLAETMEDWTEPPLFMPESCKVRVEGFYDAVASCRRFYNTHDMTWTGRDAPDWFAKEELPAPEEA